MRNIIIMAISVVGLCAFSTPTMAGVPGVGPSGPVGPTYTPPPVRNPHIDTQPSGPSPAERASIEANEKGVEYFKNKDYDNAIKYFKESLRFEDQRATRKNLQNAYNGKGDKYYMKGDYDNAIKYYREAMHANQAGWHDLEPLRNAEQKKKEQMEAESRRLEEQRREEQRKQAKTKVNNILDNLKTALGGSTSSGTLGDLTKGPGASTSADDLIAGFSASTISGGAVKGPALRQFERGTKDSAPVDLRGGLGTSTSADGLIANFDASTVSGGAAVQGLPQANQQTDELVKKEALKHKSAGDYLIQRGEYEAAEKELEEALNLSPYDEDTRQSLLDLYRKQVPDLLKEDRLDEAYVQLRKALALNPSNAALRKNLEEFGAVLGYPPLTKGVPPQTPPTGKQAKAGSKGGTGSQGAGKLTPFQGVVPKPRPGDAATTPTGSGGDIKSGAMGDLLGAVAEAIAAAEQGWDPAKDRTTYGFDRPPENTQGLPKDIPDVTGGPVKYIIPEGLKKLVPKEKYETID
ncbi:MAG: tetratricopeptide repeat protein, partial [Candidatus Brocadiales bacterium]|nr:tetratricopeptide repeat protein [Candidatus Bathyanammoxibius amoris]